MKLFFASLLLFCALTAQSAFVHTPFSGPVVSSNSQLIVVSDSWMQGYINEGSGIYYTNGPLLWLTNCWLSNRYARVITNLAVTGQKVTNTLTGTGWAALLSYFGPNTNSDVICLLGVNDVTSCTSWSGGITNYGDRVLAISNAVRSVCVTNNSRMWVCTIPGLPNLATGTKEQFRTNYNDSIRDLEYMSTNLIIVDLDFGWTLPGYRFSASAEQGGAMEREGGHPSPHMARWIAAEIARHFMSDHLLIK